MTQIGAEFSQRESGYMPEVLRLNLSGCQPLSLDLFHVWSDSMTINW